MSKTNRRNSLADNLKDNIKQYSAAHELADLRVGKIDQETGKTIELIDIHTLKEAPKDWDQFPDPAEEEYIQLKFSIIEVGLINPIIVWDRGREGKMILAGKTRTRIFKDILESGEGNSDVDYSKIPAIVFERREIDEDRAKDIIIESNTEQRKDNTKDLPFVVQHKVERIMNRKNKSGDTMDKVAREMNLSRTKIYEEKILASEIHENIVNMYYDGILNRKTVLRFNRIDYSAQGNVYESILKDLSREDVKKKNIDARSKRLRKGMSFEEIKECLTVDPEDLSVLVTLRVPKDAKKEFMKMAKSWIENYNE